MTAAEIRAVVQRSIAELDPGVRRLVGRRVQIQILDRPTRLDFERGADRGITAQSPGYFYGRRMGDESEVYEEEDDGEATPVDDAGGTIVLFARNITDRDHAAEVFAHELAHFLGSDDDDLEELSGDVTEGDEVIEVDDDEEG